VKIRRSLVLTALLSALAVGCKDSTSSGPMVDGRWYGYASTSGLAFSLSLTLTQSGESVTGTGSLASGVYGGTVTVTGTHRYPSLSITLSAPRYYPAYYRGTLENANRIVGSLTGSGFQAVGMILNKQ